jgi:hypothetical protein
MRRSFGVGMSKAIKLVKTQPKPPLGGETQTFLLCETWAFQNFFSQIPPVKPAACCCEPLKAVGL